MSGSVRVSVTVRVGIGFEMRVAVRCRSRANGWRGMLTGKAQRLEPREFLEGGGQSFGAYIADLIAWSVCGGGGGDRRGTSGRG